MELLGLSKQTAVGAVLDEAAIGANVESIGSVETLYGTLKVAGRGG